MKINLKESQLVEHGLLIHTYEYDWTAVRTFFYKAISKEKIDEGVNSLYRLIEKYPNRKSLYFSKELRTSVKNIERWRIK